MMRVFSYSKYRQGQQTFNPVKAKCIDARVRIVRLLQLSSARLGRPLVAGGRPLPRLCVRRPALGLVRPRPLLSQCGLCLVRTTFSSGRLRVERGYAVLQRRLRPDGVRKGEREIVRQK
jgi:hypothetical protein